MVASLASIPFVAAKCG
ncbi:variable surface lipoprotein, partial [Mycoplasmopsis bovis]